LLDENKNPTEEETRYWLAGNLCRCTGYDKIIRAVLDTRPQDACDQPLAPTGYTDSTAFVHLHGQVGQGGLTSLELTADPYPLTLNACMTPGTPAYPCGGAPVTYPTTATVLLKIALSLGKPTT
jgi:hypothetical protein